MRELYNEFFRVAKNERIREKVILARFAMTIVVILISLTAISLSAYAYFSHDITSNSTIIKAANFETNVGIKIESPDGEAVEVRTSNHVAHAATLTGGKTYYVTLEHTERSTVQTGFVTIIVGGDTQREFHTQQIGRNEDGTTKTIAFSIKPSADAEIIFDSHWGTSSLYPTFKDVIDNSDLYIQNGEAIEISISVLNENSGEENAEDNTETTPPEQQTLPPVPHEQDKSDTSSESIAVEENEPQKEAQTQNESSDIATAEVEN